MGDDYLKLVERGPQAFALYEIVSDSSDARMERYIASTPETRLLCTESDIVDGMDGERSFRDLLQGGIMRVFSSDHIGSVLRAAWKDAQYVDVFYIMRGGLNFDASRAVGRLGKRRKEQYIMCQRFPKDDDRREWDAISSGEAKIFEKETPEDARKRHFVFGDIVACGTSLEAGLERLFERMMQKTAEFKEEGHDVAYSMGSLTFFTIGGINAERRIAETVRRHEKWISPDFVARIVYFEARAGLAGPDTSIPLQTMGTDLYPYVGEGAVPTPEFEKVWFGSVYPSLEACIVYDGGSRRCNPQAALREVVHYLETAKSHAREKGYTLHQAIDRQIPVAHVDDVKRYRTLHPAWKDHASIPDKLLQEIIDAKNSTLAGYKDTNADLLRAYDGRIAEVRALL